MYVGILNGMDFDDICQVLRVKVWKALEKFDASLYPTQDQVKARDSFIFGCVRNQVKDLVKRNKEQALYIEDVAPANTSSSGGPFAQGPRDKFDERYLQASPDSVFREVEEGDPLIPSTLSENERLVLICMYLGYKQPEIALRIGLDRRKVASAVRNIRKKMEDWRPTSVEDAEKQAIAA